MQKSMDMRNRIYFIAIIIFLSFSSLVVRLFWIDFIKGPEYAKEVKKQRDIEVRLSMPRGMIYDRNLIPLVNRDKQLTLFVLKDIVANNDTLIKQLEKYIPMTEDRWNEIFKSSKNVIEINLSNQQADLIIEDNIKNVLIANKVSRYDGKNMLSHVIGYAHPTSFKGELGIEKYYEEEYLSRVDEKKGVIRFTIDGRKNVIPGLGVTEVSKGESNYTNSIQLTIDYHIQKLVEEVLGDTKGAVVVAEVETGDIVAMASRPNFDQNNVGQHVSSDEMDFLNRAMQLSYNPGSIFKIVVLLSALENNIVDLSEVFICTGSEEAYGVTFRCNKEEGHGEISIQEGFAHSCNSVFIQLGKRLGSHRIIETAKKLGLGDAVNIGNLEEEDGRLPEGDELLGAAIGNISIGQDKIEVTPLQVTNMMMIIANDGVQKDMSIIKGFVTENGDTGKIYPRDEDIRIISLYNSTILKKYLESVLDYGTASHLDLSEVGGGAGKTGSAQAGKENEIIHGWFSGYFPRRNPRYVITVFVEEGGAGGKSAGPIFEYIAKGIEGLGRN